MVVCGKLIDLNIAKNLAPEVIYQRAFIPLVISAIIALVCSIFSRETKCENIFNK